MNLPCLTHSRISKTIYFSAVFFSLLLSLPATGTGRFDAVADDHRREFVAALLQSAKGEYQSAIEHHRKLLITDPDNAALHYALSKNYLALGIIDSARFHSEKSVQLNPDNKHYLTLLGGISHQMNNYRAAADRYRQLATLEHGAGKERLLFTLGQLYFQTAQYDLAIKTFKELLQENPRAISAWLALFESTVRTGNTTVFRQELEQLYSSSHATLDQKVELARLFVIRATKERAYVDSAYLMITAIQQHYPGNPRLTLTFQVLQAELLFQTGNTKKALFLLQKVVRSKHTNKEKWLYLQANSTLALCYDKLGQYSKCIRLYESILRVEPENILMMNNLAYILAVQGKSLPRARELAMKAATREPANASYLDTLGWVLFKMGMYEQSREQLEKAGRLNSREAEIFEHLSTVYEKLGNSRKAIEMRERAKTLKNR
ncbi:MAG: tetratricopeptide repeat protein [Chlorobium sp.]